VQAEVVQEVLSRQELRVLFERAQRHASGIRLFAVVLLDASELKIALG
jgi:hypothetical protein